jgi:hypothetical protein
MEFQWIFRSDSEFHVVFDASFLLGRHGGFYQILGLLKTDYMAESRTKKYPNDNTSKTKSRTTKYRKTVDTSNMCIERKLDEKNFEKL